MGDDQQDDTPGSSDSSDDDMSGAVDEALADEVKRQKARFVQAILGMDRIDGTGRVDERWNEGFDHRHGDGGSGG